MPCPRDAAQKSHLACLIPHSKDMAEQRFKASSLSPGILFLSPNPVARDAEVIRAWRLTVVACISGAHDQGEPPPGYLPLTSLWLASLVDQQKQILAPELKRQKVQGMRLVQVHQGNSRTLEPWACLGSTHFLPSMC